MIIGKNVFFLFAFFVTINGALYHELRSKNDPRNRRMKRQLEKTTSVPNVVESTVEGGRKERDVNDVEFLVYCENDAEKCTRVKSFDLATKGATTHCTDMNLYIQFGAYNSNFSEFVEDIHGYIPPEKSVIIQSRQKKSHTCLKIKRFCIFYFFVS